MSHDPYAAPESNVADPAPATPIAQPKQIHLAVNLMWASLLLGIVSIALSMARDPGLRDPNIVAVNSCSMALSLALLIGVQRGRNWARIVFTLLMPMYLFYLMPMEEPFPPSILEYILIMVGFCIDVTTLYLVWSPVGARWFRQQG